MEDRWVGEMGGGGVDGGWVGEWTVDGKERRWIDIDRHMVVSWLFNS